MKHEPVRVIGYIVAALVTAATIGQQIADDYDEESGWLGLVLAVVVAVATEIQRSKVTPVAKLNEIQLPPVVQPVVPPVDDSTNSAG